MTIKHPRQQKALFQFLYQLKARVKADKELIWLELKLSHVQRGGGRSAGPRWS